MKEEFTTAEYITRHRLGVSVYDRHAAEAIAAHLQRQGYKKIRRRVGGIPRLVWVKASRTDLESLKEKLRRLNEIRK